MAGKISLVAALIAAMTLTSGAVASSAETRARHDRRGHHHAHRTYDNRADHSRRAEAEAAAQAGVWGNFGSIIYGYPYGTPCYQYNDRDWDYEKVC